MITIAPLLAILILLFLNPAEFGGSPNWQGVFIMYSFALITIPLWITYIPSIILTPIIMHKISKHEVFYSISIIGLISLSLLSGAILGVLIMSPILWVVHSDPDSLFFTWVLSGAVSGSITLTVIVLIYRIGKTASMAKKH